MFCLSYDSSYTSCTSSPSQPLPPYPYLMAMNFGSVVLVDVRDDDLRLRALQAVADCTDAPQRVNEAMVREFEDGTVGHCRPLQAIAGIAGIAGHCRHCALNISCMAFVHHHSGMCLHPHVYAPATPVHPCVQITTSLRARDMTTSHGSLMTRCS